MIEDRKARSCTDACANGFHTQQPGCIFASEIVKEARRCPSSCGCRQADTPRS